jgi:hypothetical protein
MAFAIKIDVAGPDVAELVLMRQKTMYGGRAIAAGDTVFVFASENEGGKGLMARGIVLNAQAVPPQPGIARQTPRVTLAIRCDARATRALGRIELRSFEDWRDGKPETELNFKLYRQATNKVIGVSDETAAFLQQYFEAAG